VTHIQVYIHGKKEILRKIRSLGFDPYPYRFEKTHTLRAVIKGFEDLSSKEEIISLAGRLVSLRGHGKTYFAHLTDGQEKLQIYVRQDEVGERAYSLFKLLNVGDFLGAKGRLFRTKTGEPTLKVEEFELLSKSLRPLPEKWHGLQDKELRYRQRYLDLTANLQTRKVFEKRTEIIRFLRRFLDERGFWEVETPILQPLYGGAFAQPFLTHHQALDQTLFLRIADELYLKRLIVGGFEMVYEFGKDFRNEGMDRTHNPEFTQLELYQAYADYQDIMNLTEEMITDLAQAINGSLHLSYQGEPIDLSPPWRRLAVRDSLLNWGEVDIEKAPEEELRELCESQGIDTAELSGRGKLIEKLLDQLVEPKLRQPTFLIDYPQEISPLAKSHRSKPGVVERFELFIGGLELGNAFSELNDPEEQKDRFDKQIAQKGEEDKVDKDFLTALEYGMPPTGGLGIGIDRLVMLFTDQPSIRDVILFPQLRPED